VPNAVGSGVPILSSAAWSTEYTMRRRSSTRMADG
jgi:hypothetical protein